MDDAIWTTVCAALAAESHGWEARVITPQTPLAHGGLELSSLEVVRAVVRLEDALGIELSDDAFWAVDPRTVGDLLEMMSTALPAARSASSP